MKKFFKGIITKANERIAAIKAAFTSKVVRAKTVLAANAGEGYIDTGVKIIIGVVVGGVILAGLYALFDKTVIPKLTKAIGDMFVFKG